MAKQYYLWKGPPTVIEVWPDPVTEADLDRPTPGLPIYSGHVATGQEIPEALPPGNSQVQGWLAFKLIEPIDQKAPDTKPVVSDGANRSTIKKERADG